MCFFIIKAHFIVMQTCKTVWNEFNAAMFNVSATFSLLLPFSSGLHFQSQYYRMYDYSKIKCVYTYAPESNKLFFVAKYITKCCLSMF